MDYPRTLPLNVLLKGRPCLVVGGGKVAYRKCVSLVEAEAEVSVISPEYIPAFDTFAEGALSRVYSRFEEVEPELGDYFLVIAATSAPEVNLHIVRACDASFTLCVCVDSQWREGSCIFPAQLRTETCVISVSTEGKKCTRAAQVRDIIKESLPIDILSDES